MTKSHSTKRALLTSAVALMLCMSMLVGTTFAWFTDNVTSANNRIMAGNLKVDLLMDKAGNGSYASIANGNGDIFSEAAGGNGINWEPGKTEIVYLAVANTGSLALKYNIILDIEDQGLIGSLEYAVVDGAKAADLSSATKWSDVKAIAQAGDVAEGRTVAAENGALEGGITDTDYFALAVHMKEDAGNEYQGKSITIDVNVAATQLTAEDDSFDNQYDKDAEMEIPDQIISVKNADDFVKALSEGNSVTLKENVVLTQPLVVNTDDTVVIDLGGKTVTGSQTGMIKADSGNLIITNGTIKNGVNSASRSVTNNTSIELSGDVVAKITGVTIETEGTGIALSDKARITELNATVESYLDTNGARAFDAVSLNDNARIDVISGGVYTSNKSEIFINTWYNDPKHSYSAIESYPIALNSPNASIGEISGGKFLGEMDKANNGTPIHVNSGRIEKISGGYFGFCKFGLTNPIRNTFINSNNGGSIGAITGGTFEKGTLGTGYGCEFESIVDASGCKVAETGETVDVKAQFSTSVKTYTLNVVKVVAK